VGEDVTHTLEVISVALSQTGAAPDRRCAFVDANRDLYLATVLGSDENVASSSHARAGSSSNAAARAVVKLATMVDDVRWSDTTDMLAAVVDGRLQVW